MSEKVKGVNWNKSRNKWVAQIKIDGKLKHLGYFVNYEDAIKARKVAELKYGYVPVTPAPKFKHKNDLTQEMLKKLLHYDKDTGIFTRLVKTHNKINIGDIAGSLDAGYIRMKIDNKSYFAHRLAFLYMEGKFPEDGLEVDHINQIKNDNRWINLRLVTHQGNMRNTSMRKDNPSGVVGVCLDKTNNKWAAYITVNGKKKHLGLFDNKEDAVAARKAAEIKYNYYQNHGSKNNQLITEED